MVEFDIGAYSFIIIKIPKKFWYNFGQKNAPQPPSRFFRAHLLFCEERKTHRSMERVNNDKGLGILDHSVQDSDQSQQQEDAHNVHAELVRRPDALKHLLVTFGQYRTKKRGCG